MSGPADDSVGQPLDGAVAKAVDKLRDLEALPVEAHVEVFERVHTELDQTLTHADPDHAPASEAQ